MTTALRRVALGMVLGGAMVGGAAFSTLPAAAQSCDPSYPDFCIQPAYEVGDLDCSQVPAAWFTVYAPDPHGFDADVDGYGCEAN